MTKVPVFLKNGAGVAVFDRDVTPRARTFAEREKRQRQKDKEEKCGGSFAEECRHSPKMPAHSGVNNIGVLKAASVNEGTCTELRCEWKSDRERGKAKEPAHKIVRKRLLRRARKNKKK